MSDNNNNDNDNDTVPAPPPDIFSVGDLVAQLLQVDQNLPITFGTQIIEDYQDGSQLRNFLLDPTMVKIVTNDKGEDPMAVVLFEVIDEWSENLDDDNGQCDCDSCHCTEKCNDCDCEDEDVEEDVVVQQTSKKYLN